MTTPANGDTVTIDYVLRRTDGQEIGNTEQAGPQEITLGSGQIFPAIEQALSVMQVGDTQTVAIACADAFGPRNETLVMEIPRSDMPPGPDPQPGMTMQAERADGQPITLHILEVGVETIRLDGNHALAGEDLTFDITLRTITRS
ncbi:MAG: FKBP-type peptidyl-prolyl cis-trans isomerase [Erythrobacter sp.]